MPKKLSELTTEELLKEYRQAVACAVPFSNHADIACLDKGKTSLATLAKFEGELKRRLEEWHREELLRRVRSHYPLGVSGQFEKPV